MRFAPVRDGERAVELELEVDRHIGERRLAQQRLTASARCISGPRTARESELMRVRVGKADLQNLPLLDRQLVQPNHIGVSVEHHLGNGVDVIVVKQNVVLQNRCGHCPVRRRLGRRREVRHDTAAEHKSEDPHHRGFFPQPGQRERNQNQYGIEEELWPEVARHLKERKPSVELQRNEDQKPDDEQRRP